jgi:pimeloyl-ACP methyl ester carboxylesterase
MAAAPATLQTTLLTIHSADGTPLDGVHYARPGDERPPAARPVVNFLHGRSMNFYIGVQRFAAADLVAAGYDVLAMNRRSAGVAGIRDSFSGVGDAWTLWREHRMDVEAAVLHLRGQGYGRIVMAGHSQGGLLAVDYAVKNPDVSGLILASPAAMHRGLPSAFPEAGRGEVAERARAMVAEGKERELILLPMWPWIMSAESVVDPLRPGAATPLDELLARYRGTLLVFCGDAGHDARLLPGARAAFGRSPSPAKRLEVLEGCDHFYMGFEERVIILLKGWLASHVPPS